MVQKKKIKLKRPAIILLWVFGVFFTFLLAFFLFYQYQIHTLQTLGYTRSASKNILGRFKKDYVTSVGENKTLNAAFESDDYDEKNLDHYQKIKYQDQTHLIQNINKLIKKGYSDYEISMIVTHGDDQAVSDFAKREKIRYLEEFYSISYARLENYDRYLKYMDEEREDEETTVLHVNLNLDIKDYEQAVEVVKFSTDMFVNKHHYLAKDFKVENLVTVEVKDNQVWVHRINETKPAKQMHGTTRSIINGMVQGVFEGFKKILLMTGTGYRAQMEGQNLVLNLGYSHQIFIKPVDGVKIEVISPTEIHVSGCSKEVVGQVAAEILNLTKEKVFAIVQKLLDARKAKKLGNNR